MKKLKNIIKNINWKKVAFWISLGSFVSVILGTVILLVLIVWFSKDLPNPNNVIRREGFATRMYDRNGKLLYDLYKDVKRVTISSSDVPEGLKQAVVAIEDKDFYRHKGFDPLTVVRIPYNLIFRQRLVGGSTLTQQLVKNAVLETNERSISRKVKEFVLSVSIESKFSKDDILLMYLNEAPYGGPNWGAGTASETYFGKPLKDINLTEAVILAGIPQRPNVFNPNSKTPLAYIDRSGLVLSSMVNAGYISQELANSTFEEVKKYKFNEARNTLIAPHFVYWVRDSLIKEYGEQAIEMGLKVTTTLDLDTQDKVQQIVSDEIDKSEKLGISNGAALVMDPRDGQVLAMVGSRGFNSDKTDGQVNVVTRPRQPGSTIKPITYLLALRNGNTPSSMLLDTPVSLPIPGQKNYEPGNYSGKFLGPISLAKALGNSINITAVKLQAQIGTKAVLQQAYDMGIDSLEPNENNLKSLGYSLSLGGGEVTMLEMTTAYSSFANGGKRVDPVGILQIDDRSGRTLTTFKPIANKTVMTPQESFLISNILSENTNREITFGTKNGLIIPNYQVAVKTGTTNNKRDNWSVGWTPNLISMVWVGNNNGEAMLKVASGVSGATPIWKSIMQTMLPNRPKQDFVVPDGVIKADLDSVSGYPSHDGLSTTSYYAVTGSLSGGIDQIHQKLNVCKDKFGLATPEDMANNNYNSKEFIRLAQDDPVSTDGKNRWQEGIDKWISTQNADAQEKYKVPTEYCRSGGLVDVGIETPSNQSTVGSTFDIRVNPNSVKKIVEVRVLVDGSEKLKWTEKPYEGKLTLPDGVYKIKVIAKDKDGNEGNNEIKIGVNKPWDWTGNPTPVNTLVPVSPTPTSGLPTPTI